MKNKFQLLIPREILLFLGIAGFFIVLLGALLKITHFSIVFINGNILLTIGTVATCTVWIIVMIDLIRNQVQSKVGWFIGILLMGSVVSIIYLIYRKNHLIN